MTPAQAKRPGFCGGLVLLAVVAAVAAKLLQRPPSSHACQALRSFLDNSYHVDSWYHEGALDGTEKTAKDFPIVPLDVLTACGAESFHMPHPFRFRFDPRPPSPDGVVEKLLALNKTVATRPMNLDADESLSTPFGIQHLTAHGDEEQPFSDAWTCISAGTCACYFDNTWKPDDMNTVLPQNGVMELIRDTHFGSIFMSNFPEHRSTAVLHAAPLKSIALQVTGHKVWHFLSPRMLKRAFVVQISGSVTTTTPIVAMDDFDLLRALPRYTVHTHPGEGIYFPAFWAHTVETDAGVSLMSNFRQHMDPAEILFHSPHTMRNTAALFVKSVLARYVLPKAVLASIVKWSHQAVQNHLEGIDRFAVPLFKANLQGAEK